MCVMNCDSSLHEHIHFVLRMLNKFMAVAWCTECSTSTVSVMLLTIPVVQGQLQGRGKFPNPVKRDIDCNSDVHIISTRKY